MEFTKNEKSLLLYLETCCVDQCGKVDLRCMNDEDKEIASRWSKEKFIQFGRIASESLIYGSSKSHWCQLSEEAWKLAHQFRKEKADRNKPEGNYKTTNNGYQGKI